MRALWATAVACLALTACGQAELLPPGLASRITATGGVFSLAVPDGWSDLTGIRSEPTTIADGITTHHLVVGPDAQRALSLDVTWDTYGNGVLDAGQFIVHATIAGQVATGFKEEPPSGDALIQFEHSLNGQRTYFNVTCSPALAANIRADSNQSDPCLGIIDSWRWEPPSSSHVLPIAVGAITVGALGGGLTLLAVRRRRHGSTPVELGDGP